VTLALLGLLAAFSTLVSEMPRLPAAPVAALALIWGAALARQEWRRPVRVLCVDVEGAATLDGVPLASLDIRWRGTLGFVSWRDEAGRRGSLIGAPDVLDPAMRRNLRLLARSRQPAQRSSSMAP